MFVELQLKYRMRRQPSDLDSIVPVSEENATNRSLMDESQFLGFEDIDGLKEVMIVDPENLHKDCEQETDKISVDDSVDGQILNVLSDSSRTTIGKLTKELSVSKHSFLYDQSMYGDEDESKAGSVKTNKVMQVLTCPDITNNGTTRKRKRSSRIEKNSRMPKNPIKSKKMELLNQLCSDGPLDGIDVSNDFQKETENFNPAKRRKIENKSGLFQCEDCKKRFKRMGNLKAHQKGCFCSGPFTCHFCNKVFKKHESMRKHLDQHRIYPSYPCKICSKLFKTFQQSVIHRAYEHKVQMCTLCADFQFKNPAHKRAHLKKHK